MSEAQALSPSRGSLRPQTGAFFDMDKTLISENSGALLMRYQYERGEASGWDLATGLASYLRYKIGALDIESWTAEMASQFAGRRESDLIDEAREWFKERVAPTIYPEARELVTSHLEQGHVVAIVSGATRFVTEPMAASLGVAHFLCTRVAVEQGCLTGKVVSPVCFEEGKVYWLRRFVAEHNVDLAKSWFYTDSVTDLPVLERVGHPVVTNPDPFLYRAAVQRHWPVRFFTPPDEEGNRAESAKV